MQRILYISIFLFSLQVHAQQFLFKTWNSVNGLIVSDINAIAQDDIGFLWLATEGGGLARFDGNEFVNYTVKDGLPSDFVTALKWYNNQLFVGTEKGVCIYNGLTFNRLDSIQDFNEARVNFFAESEERLFVAFKRGLQEYGQNGFTNLRKNYFINQQITSLHASSEELIISCDSGLVGYNLKQQKWFKKDENKDLVFYCQSPDFRTEITATSKQVNIAVDGLNKTLPLDRVKSASAINTTDLLIGFKRGFAIVKEGEPTYYGPQNGLKADLVKALYVDKYNNIWVGSSNGLFKFVNPSISTISQEDGLHGEHVHAILEDQNRIWFGTNDGIEYYEDGAYYLVDEVAKGLVFNIVKDNDGVVWFATEMGLVKYQDDVFTNMRQFNYFDDSFVFDVVASKKGGLYLSSGMSVYYYKDNKVTDLFKDIPLPINGARKIIEGEDGALWIYRLDGDLARFQNGEVNVFNNVGDIILADYRINSFDVLSERELLMGTAESGLIYWDGFNTTLIDESVGLFSNQVLAVQKIGNEKAIVLSEEGLQLLTYGEDYIIERYIGEEDGFKANEGIVNALVLSNNNIVWAGTKTGAVRLDLDLMLNQKVQYKPIITAVDLFFKRTDWSLLEKDIKPWKKVPEELKLSYEQNYLTFKFSALTSTDPSLLHFRYKLEGQDDSWTTPDNRREAIFTSIAPGKYTFIVETSNSKDFSEVKRQELIVKIVPPFWRTIWFWVIVVSFFGAIVFFVVRDRIVQLNQKIELETALSESERKALRLQMNPHFIFNALDSISGFIFKNEPKMAVKYLNNFAKLMRLTLETSREVLIPLETELNLIKNYLSIEQLRFSNSFDFEIIVDEEIDSYEVVIPPMLIQPNLENSILHGLRPKKEQGKLTVEFKKGVNTITCEITDNGVGRAKSEEINKARTGKHKGLASDITSERIMLLSRTLGKDFDLKIVDLFENQGKPSGTKIILCMPLIIDDGFD